MRAQIRVAALVGVLLCTSYLAGAEVINGDFETADLSGWTPYGQVDVQGDVVHSGFHATYIGTVDFDRDEKNDFTGASGDHPYTDNALFQEIDVAPGMTTIDIWYNVFTWDCAPLDDPAFKIRITGLEFTIAAGDIRPTCYPSVLGSTGWQLFSLDISEFAGAKIYPFIYAGGGANVQSWAYVDDIVVHAPEPEFALCLGAALVTIAGLARARTRRAAPS